MHALSTPFMSADEWGGVLGNLFTCRAYETHSIALPLRAQSVDCLVAASTADHLTGAIVWPVARATAAYVQTLPLAHVASVLELGAGCGLVGLAASASLPAGALLALTDGEEEMLPLMARNLPHAAPGVRTLAARLRWGDAGDAAELAARSGVERWDLIVGADVVYWRAGIEPLAASVAALLAHQGLCIIGYYDRLPGNADALDAALAAHALRAERVPLDAFELPGELDAAMRAQITMLRIRWAA